MDLNTVLEKPKISYLKNLERIRFRLRKFWKNRQGILQKEIHSYPKNPKDKRRQQQRYKQGLQFLSSILLCA